MQGVLTLVCRTSMKTLALNPACTYNQTWSSRTELRYEWGCKGASLKKNLRFYWRRRFFLSHPARKCHCEGVSPKQHLHLRQVQVSLFKRMKPIDRITSFEGRLFRIIDAPSAEVKGLMTNVIWSTWQMSPKWNHGWVGLISRCFVTKKPVSATPCNPPATTFL